MFVYTIVCTIVDDCTYVNICTYKMYICVSYITGECVHARMYSVYEYECINVSKCIKYVSQCTHIHINTKPKVDVNLSMIIVNGDDSL